LSPNSGAGIERTETVPDARLATAILIPGSMPHEYPTTMFELVVALVARGIPFELLRLTIEIGVLKTRAVSSHIAS
jgi:hypothetical protein